MEGLTSSPNIPRVFLVLIWQFLGGSKWENLCFSPTRSRVLLFKLMKLSIGYVYYMNKLKVSRITRQSVSEMLYL